MRGSRSRKEGGKESLKGEVSFFCVSLSGPKGEKESPSCAPGAASHQNRAEIERTRTPEPPGGGVCSQSVCAAGNWQGRGRAGTCWVRGQMGGGILYISVNSCVYNLY